MNAEKQTGLKVTVSDKDDALWMRNSATLEGISSRGYLKDGTQQKIIAALEHALGQARGELLCWNNTDGVPDVGATAT
ncbi:Rrf2 family transcriptional regulator [Salmonella enterica]|nr:Rrf2 family transcriptional regulator [Salmonella enterica]